MNSFNELALPELLQKLLTDQKFTVPTEIQSMAISPAIEGSDVIASAQTGSGKTLAYLIPIFSEIIKSPQSKALVLAPTRELAKQISDVARLFIEKLKDTRVTLIVGGADIRRQMKSLKNNPQLIIATPGRLNDHLRRKSLKLSAVKFLVLDEGDRMLDMGFAPQIDEIFRFLPKNKQTLLYTATMPKKIENLVNKYMVKPKYIFAGLTSQTVSNIKQRAIFTTKSNKEDLLIDELNKQKGPVIVFTKTKRGTDILSKSLKEIGFKISKIHGDRTQGQRNQAIQNFRDGKSSILCATDVSSRGIDVPGVKLVVNYDPPVMEEDYIHRIGRTARNGASGEALSILLPSERRIWMNLQRKYKAPEPEMPSDPEILKALKKATLTSGSQSSQRGRRGRSHARSNGGEDGRRGRSYARSNGGEDGRRGSSYARSNDGEDGRRGSSYARSNGGEDGRRGSSYPRSNGGEDGRRGSSYPRSNGGEDGRRGSSYPRSNGGEDGRRGSSYPRSNGGEDGRRGSSYPRSNGGEDGRRGSSYAPRSNGGEDGRRSSSHARSNGGEDGRRGSSYARSNGGEDGRRSSSHAPRSNGGEDGRRSSSHAPRSNGGEDGRRSSSYARSNGGEDGQRGSSYPRSNGGEDGQRRRSHARSNGDSPASYGKNNRSYGPKKSSSKNSLRASSTR